MIPLRDWVAFHIGLLCLLLAELAFSRIGLKALAPEPRARRQHRNAIAATTMWIAAALAFALYIHHALGAPSATQFLAGYAVEESLSIDNLFVFILLFRIFTVPPTYQPRVLFWGVLGAILLRGLFIAAGLSLLARFQWITYLFAVILLVAAVRLVLPESHDDAGPELRRTPIWVRWISRIHPVSLRSDRFFTIEDGSRRVTMLFLCLLAIETADIVFALDSIPAVLSITRHPFLAYTSNILAVMGLRSLFFLLAQALKQLRFLHYGLAAILAFAALKMLGSHLYEVGPLASLAIILAILAFTISVSLLFKSPTSAAAS